MSEQLDAGADLHAELNALRAENKRLRTEAQRLTDSAWDGAHELTVAVRNMTIESCAKVAEADNAVCGPDCTSETCGATACFAARRIAAAIRARGGK